MRKLHRLLIALLTVAMLFTLAACATPVTTDGSTDGTSTSAATTVSTETDTAKPVYGGSASVYFWTISGDIDPAAPDFESYMLWYERLFALDMSIKDSANGFKDLPVAEDMTGQIADTYQWDAAAKTLTVNIRDDIKFQTLDAEYDYYGGRGLKASDIKYSYDRALGIGSGFSEPAPSKANWKSTYYMIESIETTGDYTVVFHFNTDADVAVDDFKGGMLSIAGPEFDKLTADQKADWHYACGTGPYILTDFAPDSYMTFTKNADYYDTDERYPENKLPYLDTITLVKVMDTASLLSQFIAGQIDFIGNNQSVFSASELSQIAATLDSTKYTAYPLDITSRAICLKQTCEPLTNIKVRQAMQYAINLAEINSSYFGNQGDIRLNGLFGNYSKFCATSTWSADLKASYYTYDPEKARQMLAEAGYADGFKFTLAYMAAGDVDIYTLVQEYLAAVGITMELNPVAIPPEYFNLAASSENQISSIGNLSLTNTEIAINSWLSGTPFNAMGGKDEKMDSLINATRTTRTAAEQISAMQAFDNYLMEQHYMLAIGPVEKSTFVVSTKIGGYNGESIYAGWNGSTILARLWSVTGK